MIDPEFRVAQIVYVTDVTREGAPIIPLGVFAEASNQKSRGLALKARKSLSAAEREMLSPLLRDLLMDPFAYFHSEFRDAWDNAPPGRALEYLGKRHASGLRILGPKDCDETIWFLQRLIAPKLDALEAKLTSAVDREYEKFWRKPDIEQDSEKVFIERKKAA
ncbi:MAG: hypothetical protein WDM86_17800 [Rhizomicrobium sp.]